MWNNGKCSHVTYCHFENEWCGVSMESVVESSAGIGAMPHPPQFGQNVRNVFTSECVSRPGPGEVVATTSCIDGIGMDSTSTPSAGINYLPCPLKRCAHYGCGLSLVASDELL